MAWAGEKEALHDAWRGHSRFSHTSLATYLTAFFALSCVGYDSTHVRGGSAQRGAGSPAGGALLAPAAGAACTAAACSLHNSAPWLPVDRAGHHPALAHQPQVVLLVRCAGAGLPGWALCDCCCAAAPPSMCPLPRDPHGSRMPASPPPCACCQAPCACLPTCTCAR